MVAGLRALMGIRCADEFDACVFRIEALRWVRTKFINDQMAPVPCG